MADILAKCGCACNRCPTFKNNIRTGEERMRCSQGWKTWLGISLSPEKLRLCDGCLADDNDKPTRYLNCIVRRCALRNGVENCAFCSNFPCDELKHVHEGQSSDYRKKIETRIGKKIPEQDYLAFVEPYEGIRHLEELRATINSEDIIDITPLTLKTKLIDFPEDLPLPKNLKDSYMSLHRILSNINIPLENISFARRETEKKRRTHRMRLLWTFGLLGQMKSGQKSDLIIDSVNYYKIKNQCQYSVLKDCFNDLKKADIHGKLVPLVENEWMNSRGVMRMKTGKKNEPAWIIELSFGKKAGDFSTVGALQSYCRGLQDKYGDTAFKFFSKADMNVV
ncbi:DUF3795 domain-containing protein [Candidatus Latescibacterota bacterium]